MLACLRNLGKRMIGARVSKPVLGDQPYGGPLDSPVTLVVVCREGFNMNILNANSTIRLGYCRAFAQIGIQYQLVSVFEVARVIPQLNHPFVFLSCYDYGDLDITAVKLLRRYPHFIWVTPWWKHMEKVFGQYDRLPPRMPKRVVTRIMDSGANFVWAPVPLSCLVYYEEWEKRGQRLESIPQACDTTRYYPEPGNQRFSDVKMAFIGGYRPYKNIQYNKYLKPYENILAVFGYNRWPYKGYGGLLHEADERLLYQNSRVCPALSEPHAEVMGDIVERAFKVMGSGGLAVTDVIPFYRELFKTNELLVPSTVDEYHEMVRRALVDEGFNRRNREAGYQAIMDRHTYVHRAITILSLLGLKVPINIRSVEGCTLK